MKMKLSCPVCGHEWTIGYWKWIFTTLFHWFSFKKMKDKRYTKCPYCGHKSWMSRTK